MDDDQQFCLRWNNHQSTLVSVFDTLLEKGIHVDCTLAAEGQTLRAHKVVLSACSPYFESVLSQQYDKHPIIILKDVKYAELRAMMDYMYRGEVNISQDQLAALLKAAESLQIKGLSDNKPSRPPSRPAQPPAHPPHAPHAPHPRAVSPPPQVRDGSVESRSGSVSPTRRRKKARRLSAESAGVGVGVVGVGGVDAPAQGNGEPHAACKEEDGSRGERGERGEGVEDLTIDEEGDDPPPAPHTHNDVVRNFQWHMERSQDEIMNSSDSVRDSQGSRSTRQSIVTRSKKNTDEAEKVTTLAVLKTVKTSKLLAQAKPQQLLASPAPSPPAAPPAPVTPAPPTPAPPSEDAKENKTQSSPQLKLSPSGSPLGSPAHEMGRFNIFSGRRPPPCAQYKTDKGYKCPNCQRCYNARKNLVRHVTLECGVEPQYKCPHCSFSKHRRNELKKHMEKKHPEHAQKNSPASSAPLAVK